MGESPEGVGEARGDSVRQVSQAVRERAGRESVFWPTSQERVLINKNVINNTLKKSIDMLKEQA